MDFVKYPKISRWSSPFDITEKIDGTNAAVSIREVTPELELEYLAASSAPWVMLFSEVGPRYAVAAQSRTRVITPQDDNYGFARWVWDNADSLATDLGPGTHFGEWWGSKIQRAYGLTNGERYFSLFDHKRYAQSWHVGYQTPNLSIVPCLAKGDHFDAGVLERTAQALVEYGSHAGPNALSDPFARPEGVVVHFHHNGARFKYILDK